MSAGTLTPNPQICSFPTPSPLQRIELAWETTVAGALDRQTPVVSGTVLRVAFVPDASAAPNTLYDVALNDADGIDVLYGAGANLSATVPSDTIPLVTGTGLPPVVRGPLDLVVTNAGNSTKGKVVLYVRP